MQSTLNTSIKQIQTDLKLSTARVVHKTVTDVIRGRPLDRLVAGIAPARPRLGLGDGLGRPAGFLRRTPAHRPQQDEDQGGERHHHGPDHRS